MELSVPWTLEGDGLQLEQFAEVAEGLMVTVSSCRRTAVCPSCGEASKHVHSRYERQVMDLPSSGRRVALSVRVRRFHCRNAGCPRHIFNERLPDFIAPYARRTDRLQECLRALGYSLGGEGGARLANRLGMPVSPDTLLRLLKRSVLPPAPTPHILGVDDFAFRRGQRYGTMLVDLERHGVVDLLPGREAKPLADWLKAHPGVKVIARDRAGAYAEGGRQGAPDAVQVADRWHLLKNVREVIERLLVRHQGDLQAVSQSRCPAPTSVPPSPSQARLQQARRQHRQMRYEQVVAKHEQGKNATSIAHELHLSRDTVRQYLRAGHFPERALRAPPPGKLTPFLEYLRKRWNAGCHTAAILWRELRTQGFTGSANLVARAVRPWRKASPAPQAAGDTPSIKAPSPRQASWWLLGLAHETNEQTQAAHQGFVKALMERCPDLAIAKDLAVSFVEMIRHHQADRFEDWLTQIRRSKIPELRGFAKGVLKDKAAIIAGLTLPWSSGQVEGQVNRLKCLKRDMYGRASLQLLRARVLHPP